MAFEEVAFAFGEPFQCPYCYMEQTVKNKTAWKYVERLFPSQMPFVKETADLSTESMCFEISNHMCALLESVTSRCSGVATNGLPTRFGTIDENGFVSLA